MWKRQRSDWRQNEDVTMAILTLNPIFKSIRMIKLLYYLNEKEHEKRNEIQFQYVNTTKWHRLWCVNKMNSVLNVRYALHTYAMFAVCCLCFHCEHFSIYMIPLCECYPNGFYLFVFETVSNTANQWCNKIPFSHLHLFFRLSISFSVCVSCRLNPLKVILFKAKRNRVNRIRIQKNVDKAAMDPLSFWFRIKWKMFSIQTHGHVGLPLAFLF